MRKKGRPLIYEADEQPMNPISIRLTVRQHRLARKIGAGNVSEGIRTALLNHVFPNKVPE